MHNSESIFHYAKMQSAAIIKLFNNPWHREYARNAAYCSFLLLASIDQVNQHRHEVLYKNIYLRKQVGVIMYTWRNCSRELTKLSMKLGYEWFITPRLNQWTWILGNAL